MYYNHDILLAASGKIFQMLQFYGSNCIKVRFRWRLLLTILKTVPPKILKIVPL